MKIVVAGGGPAGFSAATVARAVGAEVTLIERTDMLGGLGIVAGVSISHSAAIPLAEAAALGGAEFYKVLDTITIFRGIPGTPQSPTTTYNVWRLDAAMQRALKPTGIELIMSKRVVDVELVGDKIEALVLEDGSRIKGDAFVDATGAEGGTPGCQKLGRGCVGCILRCPTFGPVQGVVDKRVKTIASLNAYGKPGVIGNSLMVPLISLSKTLATELNERGCAMLPVPPGLQPDIDRMNRASSRDSGVADQPSMRQNLLLYNIGDCAKLIGIGSAMYACCLRSFPGCEDAVIVQPTAGFRGQMVQYATMLLRDNALKVEGFQNLFCAGGKAGPTHSMVDAVVLGDLAGYNAARQGFGQKCLELPKSLIIGAYIDYLGQMMRSEAGLMRRYGIKNPGMLQKLNVFREDKQQILDEVDKAGLKGVYKKKLG